MMAVQFFLFGLVIVWFTGTGKMRALADALRSNPTSGGASGGGGFDATVPNTPIVGPSGPIGNNAASLAQSQVGKSYKWGASIDTTLKSFFYDCSSLVASVYGSLGKTLPRTSQQQAGVAQRVTDPQIGDLVFASFSSPNDHVGIYVGNGNVVSALDEAHGVGTSIAARWPGVWYGRIA